MIGHKRIPSREGGVEIVVGELSKRLTARGQDVTAYNRKSEHIAGKAFDEAQTDEWEGVHIKWVKTPESSKLNALVYSARATMRALFCGYDLVHFHAEGPCAMIPLAKLGRKKCVATIHGLDWQRAKWGGFATKYLKFGEKMAAKHADAVIVLSKNVQQYFKDTYGRETVYIPNGIEAPERLEANEITGQFGLTKDSYVLYLGRLVPEKGIHRLIEAYRRIDTDKKLVIAGGSSHTAAYEAELKEAAKGCDNIIFTGFVQGAILEELYANTYLYCLPSDLEGMPISLLEAMSYGCACLTSDIPECTEVCGEHAASFAMGDTDALEAALRKLLTETDTVQALKDGASEYICRTFSWEDVADKTLDLYKDVVKR